MRHVSRIAALVLVAVAVIGCAPRAREELVIIERGRPLTLAPHLKSELVTLSVQANLMEGLVEFDGLMKVRPLLAQSWENPDDLTWVFTLRPKVRFHDGTMLTADDVVYSLDRAKQHPASTLRGDFAMVDSIMKMDEGRIRIKTSRPYPILLNRLTNVLIVSCQAMERLGDDGYSQSPIGTGPYRFESYPDDGPIRLAVWDGYWGPKPPFRRMVISGMMSQEEAIGWLKTARADIVPQLGTDLANQYASGDGKAFTVVRRQGLMIRYLGLNFKCKPFRNRMVRQAISVAIDRSALVAKTAQGYASPANQMVPQAVFGYDPQLPEIRCDPEAAKRLLKSAGYPGGIDLVLTFPEIRTGLCRLLQEQLAAAGIRLRLNPLSREDFFPAADTASLYLLGMSSTSGDASDIFDDAVHSRTKGYGSNNRGNYANPRLDRLIEQSSDYLNQSQRLKALQEIMAAVMDDMPRVPLYIEDEIYGVSAKVDWQPRLDMLVLGKEAKPK